MINKTYEKGVDDIKRINLYQIVFENAVNLLILGDISYF